ncbi:MAG: type II toxin-antitoxin system VapC family toxin [Actinobacteria bacterium]|nr:MAG: type II toxin-antitoxin system VapC family toxin [Actinomycetota bacterium]
MGWHKVTRGLLDTNIFISLELGRSVNSQMIPDELAISVITLAELEFGVYSATDQQTRAKRMATFRKVMDFEAIDITSDIASVWAVVRASGQAKKSNLSENDVWIAATAINQGVPLVTQDRAFASISDLKTIFV